jgi:phosphonate transport system substrate-binding protein
MKRWKKFVVPFVAVAAAACIVPDGNAQERKAYAFSPVNQYGINLTAAYWNPILDYVSAKSGVPLTLKIGRTSADTTSYVLANEVEFVFTNHLFSPEREKMGWQVIARRDAPQIKAELIVPADSPITDVAQLAGQDVGFPGPEAFVAYKVPHAHLIGKGIAINVVFGGNMDAALTQLFSGKVKAAGGNSQLIEGYAKRENRKYRVLWVSEPFLDLPLMASAKVPERERKAVAAAFVGMADDPKGREILRNASQTVGIPPDTRFVAADGSEYGAYRRFYQSAPPQLR